MSSCSNQAPQGQATIPMTAAMQRKVMSENLKDVRHKLFVMSGKGGDIVLAEAKRVLREEYPELDGKILPTLPDEKFRRVGQSAAAASLPELKK